MDHHDIGRGGEQFLCENTRALDIRIGPSLLDPRVAAVYPTQSRQFLHECGKKASKFRIALGQPHQHADPPHSMGFLRARDARPCDWRPAEQQNELAPSHSIASSATDVQVSVWSAMLSLVRLKGACGGSQNESAIPSSAGGPRCPYHCMTAARLFCICS